MPDRVAKATGKTGRTLEITRDFRAPRERVWRAWASPETMLRWLGPRHYPAISVSADVRVGGAWRACLQPDKDKEALWQSGKYLVVTPPERLEFTFAWEGSNHEDGPGVQTHVIVVFEALTNGETRMRFTQMGLVSQGSATGHTAGWNSTFDRLADHLRDDNAQA